MFPIPPILAFLFLAPWLMAAGAAATSIPIIIHLLNKRKFRIVIWAAMDFLLAAQKRNARRLRFQRWLLLALRCLALLVIAAGIAELVLQSKTFGQLLGQQRAMILLWDDSYSMGYQGQVTGGATGATPFERSRQLILDYVKGLKPADKVLVLRTSRISAGTAEAAAAQPTLDHAAVVEQIRSAQLTDASTDLPTTFDRAAQVLKDLEAATPTRQVVLLTDFSNSSIHDPIPGLTAGGAAPVGGNGKASPNPPQAVEGDRLKKAFQGMQAHASAPISVIDVGAADQTNMAITDIRPKRPAVVANAPADFEITILNATDQTKVDVPISVLLDGVPVQSIKVGKIEAGATGNALLHDLRIPSVGRHLIEARLPSDQLPVDDVRRLIVNARREVPVLLVDGRPGDGGKTSYDSTAYLWAAYGLPTENRPISVFAPKVITELELPTTTMGGYDIIVLSDVGELAPAMRETFKKFVEQGGLLIIFPGPRTNAQRMNDTLGDKGANLLPATLGQPVKLENADQLSQGITFAPEGYTHPVLQVFSDDVRQGKKVGVDLVQTTQYLMLGMPADGSSETILRYAKADGTPGDAAVVKKDVGQGQVVLFASTADAAWNNWGGKPSFVPFLHELTYYTMGRNTLNNGTDLTLRVGGQVHLPADTAAAGPWAAPHNTQIQVTSELDAQGRGFLTSPPLNLSGTYAPAGGDGQAVVAVNPDAEEADIRYVGSAQMAAALGIDAKQIVEQPSMIPAGDAPSSDDHHSRLGPTLVGAALVLFLLETLLAMLFSTYR